MFRNTIVAFMLMTATAMAQQPPQYNSWQIDRQKPYPTPTWAAGEKNEDGTDRPKKEVIEVYNDFGVSSGGGRMLIDILSYMSKVDSKYDYRYSNITGAGGEAAITAAVAKARSGVKTIIYSGIGAFTFNRDERSLEKMITYDKDKDFILLQSVASNQFGVITNVEQPYNTVDELVSFVRQTKDPVYVGRTTSAGTNALLGDMFLDKYKIRDKVKIVKYSKIGDMIFALQSKEITFTIHAPNEFTQAKPLLMSGFTRSPYFPDVPIGKEVGFNDFALESLTLFFVPKENAQLAVEIMPTIQRICSDKEAKDIIDIGKRKAVCMNTREILDYIARERKAIERNK